MTTAPQCLRDSRALLLAHLDIHENSSAYPTDLDPVEVGIVGDPDHRGGYHCGRDRVVSGDYSVVESTRDSSGLTYDAAGLDVGYFKVTTDRGTFDLHHMGRWIAREAAAGAPDTRDLREIIYSPDGRTVKRWDRLGRRTSGDSSHLYHNHLSIHRDAIKAGRGLVPLFTRYLQAIGLIPGEDEDDMDQATFTKLMLGTLSGSDADSVAVQRILRALPLGYPVTPDMSLAVALGRILPKIEPAMAADAARDAELRALVEKYQSGGVTANAVVDALVERLQAGSPSA